MDTSMPTPTASSRLQKEIEAFLQVDGKLYFDFSPKDLIVELSLITVSARHGQAFLLLTTTGEDRAEALTNALKALQDPQKPTFAVQWYRPDNPTDIICSYFRADHVFEILEKLYYQAKSEELMITELRLLPEDE